MSLVPGDPTGRCRLDGVAFSCARLGRMLAMDSAVLAPVESFRALRFRDQEGRVRGVLGRYDPAYGAYLPVGVSGLHGGVVGDAVVYNFSFGDGSPALGWAASNPQAGGAFSIAQGKPQNPIELTSTEVKKLESNIQKVLDDPECGKYIQAMLDSLPADINGTARSNGSLMDTFNRIKNGGGFWSKDTGPKVAAMTNPATLAMTFNSQRSTPLISSNQGWQQLGVTLTLIHELTHVFTNNTKVSGYGHLEMGRAAATAASGLGINVKATLGIELPTVQVWDEATDQAYSDYYGKVLAYACRKVKL